MTAMFEASQNKGSDLFYDVSCSVCEDKGITKEGSFHCQNCSKSYCDKCVVMHNKLLKNHPVISKCDSDNWPVSTTWGKTLELCEEHSAGKLTMLCEDHETLLCQVCHLRNHKQCRQVVLLIDKVKSSTRRMNVAQMTKTIEQSQTRLQEILDIDIKNISKLQVSYEHILEEIRDARRHINENLDRLQQNTIRELETIHASLNAYLEDNTKRCLEFISKLNGYGTQLKDNMSPERSFITFRKCLDEIAATESLIKSMKQNDAMEIKHQPNHILNECLEECTDLGKITSCIGEPQHDVDPNKIVCIQDMSQYNVQTDNMNCNITGMCEAPNGEFVILDYTNCCVKLLDQAYRVVDQLKLPTPPWSMCNINLFEVAVTVSEYDADALNGIRVLLVDNREIIQIKALKMDHVCRGIAYHNTDLFVTSGTALYQYTIDGRFVEKLYEDSSGDNTVLDVGVSPGGKRIYLTDNANDKICILTRAGAVTATLQDGALKNCYVTANLHVAATGQVFVVGDKSISQVDTVGKTILNTISVDIPQPASVYFNTHKRTLLVGFWNNDHIIEFKTTII